MYFSCEKSKLLNALLTVQKAVSAKSTLSVLEGIYIEATDKIRLIGNDLEICIEYNNEKDFYINKVGSIVLDSKMFVDIVRKLPDEVVYIETFDGFLTNIKCATTEYDLMGLSAEEYPTVPDVEHKMKITINQSILKSMIRQTVFSTAVSQIKPILTGVLFELDDNNFRAVSVDGYRLSIRNEKIEATGENQKFVVPSKTLNELLKILSDDEDETVDLYLSDKHILFKFDEFTLTSRLLEGEFLNYKSIIGSKNSTIFITTQTRPLIDCVERAGLIVKELSRSPIRFSLKGQNIIIDCTTQTAKVHEVIPVGATGGEIEIGFNYRFIIDALRATEEDVITLELSNPLSSCFIKPLEGDKYTYMILPVKLQA